MLLVLIKLLIPLCSTSPVVEFLTNTNSSVLFVVGVVVKFNVLADVVPKISKKPLTVNPLTVNSSKNPVSPLIGVMYFVPPLKGESSPYILISILN